MLLRLDGSGPLHQQLCRALRAGILGGDLPKATRVPSSRALAEEIGVSRGVVLLAYEQLLAEGYLGARHGSGTFVATELPERLTAVAVDGKRPSPSVQARAPRLSAYVRRLFDESSGTRLAFTPSRRALPYDFRYGRPSFADFPHATWNRALTRRARGATIRELDYGPAEGAPVLRDAIAGYLGRSRGVRCSPEQVLIVHGSQQALDLVARVLLDPGDRVLLEEPHYLPARVAFSAVGATVVTAPVDEQGLSVAAIPDAAGYRLAYVTPSHQFPTGVVMPLGRRLELFAWAERADALLLEDDYDSEYRYSGRPIEALQGLDRSGRVIYAGTFSKLMFPAMRLGYLVLPGPLVEAFRAAKTLADAGSPTLLQLALADFIRDGHFDRHLRRTRARNAARREALLGAIARHLGDRVEVTGANAGLHVLLWLDESAPRDVRPLLRAAAEAGVGVYPVSPFYSTPPKRAGLVLGYASLSEKEIETGIRRLATVLKLPERPRSSA